MADRHPDEVLCVLWLGSSVGNLTPADTLAFFQDMLRIGGPLTEVRHRLISTEMLYHLTPHMQNPCLANVWHEC